LDRAPLLSVTNTYVYLQWFFCHVTYPPARLPHRQSFQADHGCKCSYGRSALWLTNSTRWRRTCRTFRDLADDQRQHAEPVRCVHKGYQYPSEFDLGHRQLRSDRLGERDDGDTEQHRRGVLQRGGEHRQCRTILATPVQAMMQCFIGSKVHRNGVDIFAGQPARQHALGGQQRPVDISQLDQLDHQPRRQWRHWQWEQW
jgi:hypothetical protein